MRDHNKTKAKTYHCETCGRSFARSEHLKRHTTTHTDEKSFRCFCGKRFGRRDLLKRHEQIGRHLTVQTTPSSGATPSDDSTPATLATTSAVDSTPWSLPSDLNTSSSLAYGSLDNDFHFDAFNNFDAFLNTMGLNAPLDCIFPELLLTGQEPSGGQLQTVNGYNMPCLPPDTEAEDIHELKRIPCPWKATLKQRDDLNAVVQQYQMHLPDFKFPSALAISRHFTGYFEEFHNHLPFLHVATYRPLDCPDSPELALAIAAIGATCKHESWAASQLFQTAKTIIATRQDHQDNASFREAWSKLRTVQAAVLLAAFAVMTGGREALQDIPSLHGLLVAYAEKHDEPTNATPLGWSDWIFRESQQRTKCATFTVLNVYTLVFDTSPVLLGARLDTFLPCSTLAWTAQNESTWMEAQKSAPEPVRFQEAYAALFNSNSTYTHLHAPFGNLVLINALLQRIYLARQMQVDTNSHTLRMADLEEIESALERWTHAWRQAPESILDPRNPDASNSFASTSLLGLAFVRLHAPYASRRRLNEWQPTRTALRLSHTSNPQRSSRITPALLHATQAFAIPVKFGMEWTSRRQFHHWDLQNFVWHLEAATFLSKWLCSVADSCMHQPLSDFESKMMSIIRSLVNKAEESSGHSSGALDSAVAVEETVYGLARNLSFRLTRLWSSLYRKHNSPWPLTELIGECLEEYERTTLQT